VQKTDKIQNPFKTKTPHKQEIESYFLKLIRKKTNITLDGRLKLCM
jgi:hypothetical protein